MSKDSVIKNLNPALKASMKHCCKSDFFRITGILPKYKTNLLENREHRGSYVFNALAEKVFDHPLLLKVLLKKIEAWVREDDSEFMLSLAGYIFYLNKEYTKTEDFFLAVLNRNRKNIDSWIDLAFSLYHQNPRKQKLATLILFNFDICPVLFDKKKIDLVLIENTLKKQSNN